MGGGEGRGRTGPLFGLSSSLFDVLFVRLDLINKLLPKVRTQFQGGLLQYDSYFLYASITMALSWVAGRVMQHSKAARASGNRLRPILTMPVEREGKEHI